MRVNLIFFSILFIGVSSFLTSQSNVDRLPDCQYENCGKVVGYLIDAETKERIKEDFYVSFCDCYIKDRLKIFNVENVIYTITVKNGNFSVKIPEGQYCLQFFPRDHGSKYCFDPTPSLNPIKAQFIKVKKGQIATIRKLMKPGGSLKITLVDVNNNRINPVQLFNENINIKAKLASEKVSPAIWGFGEESDELLLNDGEIIINNLFPEKYTLNIEFENMGYGSQKTENIEIERNKTKEINIKIDINDKTGIEGKILDKNNIPLKDIYLIIKPSMEKKEIFFSEFADITSNNNGNYKIIGLKEMKYDLFVYGNINGVEIKKNFYGINIKKDIIMKKDIIIDIAN